MDKKSKILQEIIDKGLLPLYYHPSADVSISILQSLYEAGVRAVEYTNRGDAALENFKVLRRKVDGSFADMYLGIGTIKTGEQARAFIDAGADYIISPGIPADVAQVAKKNEILWMPGCLTPTEIILAESYGIEFVKLFPGNMLGPVFLEAVKDLFPEMKFMPTGGVEPVAENIAAWFKAGVSAVGMGSKLISKEAISGKNFDLVRKNTEKALALISQWRSSR